MTEGGRKEICEGEKEGGGEVGKECCAAPRAVGCVFGPGRVTRRSAPSVRCRVCVRVQVATVGARAHARRRRRRLLTGASATLGERRQRGEKVTKGS